MSRSSLTEICHKPYRLLLTACSSIMPTQFSQVSEILKSTGFNVSQIPCSCGVAHFLSYILHNFICLAALVTHGIQNKILNWSVRPIKSLQRVSYLPVPSTTSLSLHPLPCPAIFGYRSFGWAMTQNCFFAVPRNGTDKPCLRITFCVALFMLNILIIMVMLSHIWCS